MLTRRVSYEVERRLLPGRLRRPRIIPYGDGLRLEVDLSRPKERTPYLLGRSEYASTAAFLELLQPGMTVVDAGANIGEYTLLAAGAVGASGRVLAIEPNSAVRERLLRNVERNALRNVTVGAYGLGLSARSATLVFDPSDPRTGRVVSEAAGNPGLAQENVAIKPLGEALGELGWDTVDVIKLDVEGDEAAALEGGRAMIEMFHPAVLFEVNDLRAGGGEVTAPAIDWLRSRGYRMYLMGMNGARATRTELPPGADPRGRTEPGAAMNLLALRPAPPG
jgi:FkbM family methyltransferase